MFPKIKSKHIQCVMCLLVFYTVAFADLLNLMLNSGTVLAMDRVSFQNHVFHNDTNS